MKLVFLGSPGAGKGTQAARMAEQLGLTHASTGDIFRAAVAQGSELGKTVQSYLDGGKLVPDELTSRVVKQMVLERLTSYILDGYPRTIAQARALDAMLAERGEELDAVVCFELDEARAIERLTGRMVCTRCGANYHQSFLTPRREGVCDRCGGKLAVRSDSSEEVVRKRFAEYNQKTKPLRPYYGKRGLVRVVDASDDPDSISRELSGLLTALECR